MTPTIIIMNRSLAEFPQIYEYLIVQIGFSLYRLIRLCCFHFYLKLTSIIINVSNVQNICLFYGNVNKENNKKFNDRLAGAKKPSTYMYTVAHQFER